MNRFHRAALAATALTLALAGSLHAVGEGRVVGTVTDTQKKPIQGAKVLVTLPGVGSYKQEKTTDKAGKFTLLILDATKEYKIELEKEGYKSFQEALKPLIGETLRMSYTLAPEEVAAPAPDPAAVKEMEGKNQAVLAYNEGVGKLKGNDLAGASAKFEEALKHNPDLVEAHAVLADLYVDQKKYPEALAAADRVLKAKPNDAGALTAIYDAALALGDKERANAALVSLVQAAPGRDTAIRLLNKGVQDFNANRIPEAIGAFENAEKADPTLAKTQYMLGLAYANSENKESKEKARVHLTRFLEMAPNDENAAAAKEMLGFLK